MEAIILTRKQFEQISHKIDDLKAVIIEESNSNRHDRVIDNSEFIKQMSISKRTAQTWRDSGKIGFSQIGNKIYYKQSDVDSLLASNYSPKL